MNVTGRFQLDRSGLVPINYMYCGFTCLSLVRQQFDVYNGFRITMRKPRYPCKFGVHLNTAIREFEHFVGHLVDTDPSAEEGEWVEYEIPINRMVNSQIKSSFIHAPSTDDFHIKGLTFSIEKQNAQFDPNVDLNDEGEPRPIDI